MPRLAPLALSWIGALSLGNGGCGSGLPVPTFPQLQEVGQMGEYGPERIRASDACRKSTTAMDGYLECMRDKGWEFVPRASVYPASECWSLRTANDANERPGAQCFTRSPVPREAEGAAPPGP